MPAVGDPCYRQNGVASLSLPWRVRLSDGSTRTDPEQWFADPAVRADTGWSESTLTQDDIDILFPLPPVPGWLEQGYDTGFGWRLAWQADDVALLTGLYVLAQRSEQLGLSQPITVTDMDGVQHTMTFAEYDQLMLQYGAARTAAAEAA